MNEKRKEERMKEKSGKNVLIRKYKRKKAKATKEEKYIKKENK